MALGAAALPELLRRLDSRRSTSLTFDGMWHSYHRAPLFDPPKNPKAGAWATPDELSPGPALPPTPLLEGDVAYALIGQIVNRWYAPARGGNGPQFLSLPSLSPEIVPLVRRAWGGVGAASLRRSLEADVLRPDSPAREALGFQRYARYFPEAAEALAARRLRRWVAAPPAYSELGPNNFVGFVMALGPIPSEKIDRLCVELLEQYRRRPDRRVHERRPMQELVSRLYRRGATRRFALSFAREQIERGDDPSGWYARVLGLP